MLTENSEIIKKYLPEKIEQLKQVEMLSESIVIEASKSGEPTIKLSHKDKMYYLHSKYNPAKEAAIIIEKYNEKITNVKNILFYGIGLGYHVDNFITQFPNKSFFLYEPNTEVFSKLLEVRNLSKWDTKNLKSIYVEKTNIQQDDFIWQFLEDTNGDALLIALPTYERLYENEYKNFTEKFLEQMKHWRSNLHTHIVHQKRWVTNGLKNLPTLLKTPNILHDVDKKLLKDKPVIIVSAGPSLSYEIENLKFIKENNLAYIFSVGSAINTLLEFDLYPDAAFSFDPSEGQQKVFNKVIQQNIQSIPLVFGSSMGYEAVRKYPGPKLHFLASQDTVSKKYLEHQKTDDISIVVDSPSIAVMTFQILSYLECGPIILVGQNLAYLQDKKYAKGINYDFVSSDVSEEEKKAALKIQNVDGTLVETNDGFNMMRKNLEYFIKLNKKTTVINTTEKGAAIDGTIYLPLTEVIKEYLTKPLEASIEDIFKQALPHYSLIETIHNLSNEEDLNKLHEYYLRTTKALEKMEYELKVTKNTAKLSKHYLRFVEGLKSILSNEFFITFILPIFQVQFNLFVKGLNDVHHQDNVSEEIKTNLTTYKNLLEDIKESMDIIIPIHKEVIDTLKNTM